MSNQPFEQCPNFEICSVNVCPLDPNRDKCFTHPTDPEKACTLDKTTRIQIATKYPTLIPWCGLLKCVKKCKNNEITETRSIEVTGVSDKTVNSENQVQLCG